MDVTVDQTIGGLHILVKPQICGQLYAHDSALLVPGCNVKDIENTLSIEMESVNHWLVVNKLSASGQD